MEASERSRARGSFCRLPPWQRWNWTIQPAGASFRTGVMLTDFLR